MKITVFVINALIQLVAAALGFFMLLLGLNGFSSKQAEAGLFLYIILSFMSAIGMGIASAFTAQWLGAKPALGKIVASLISISVFAVVGIVILTIVFFASVLLTDALR
jgi:hypothetical protein